VSVTALRVVPFTAFEKTRATAVKRVVIYTLTVGRIALAAGIVMAWTRGLDVAAVACLAVFVLVDILDGVVARWLGLESAIRRGLDGVVDKVSIHLVAVIVCTMIPGALWIWVAIAVRDVIQAVIALYVAVSVRVVAAGAKWHRSYTSAIAVWGAGLVLNVDLAWLLGVIALSLGVATLIDYGRLCEALLSRERRRRTANAQLSR
jgi:phosphatidylglycerophosphate synthase